MATLKDIYAVCSRLDILTEFRGASAEFMTEFSGLRKAAYAAVMEEQGIDDPDRAAALPEDTVLGEKAQTALEGLKGLLPQQK